MYIYINRLYIIYTYILYIYIYIILYIHRLYIHISPQAFWQSSAPGALSTLVTSVVLYSLTRATLMSPGKDETRVCGYICIYILYIYIYIHIYIFYMYICIFSYFHTFLFFYFDFSIICVSDYVLL